jgi:O-antigen ligase/polysaccharide polymerase Wzy-like membrane protein
MAGPPMFSRVIARKMRIGGGTRLFYGSVTLTSATAHVASRPRALSLSTITVAGAWPLAAPCALLVLGAAIGYPFSLDPPVALERLLGLIFASLLALLAMAALRRVERPITVLVPTTVVVLIVALWVIAASGPDVFRGTLGGILDVIFRPIFGLVQITDPVSITNTRFIVGYNGLIDLSLVGIFACGALLLDRPSLRVAIPLVAILPIALLLLVGAGARGGLTGLAAGVCAIALVIWPRRYMLLAILAAPVALALVALGILDKGLEFSSTAGRLTYWQDLARLLVEYPFTGVGLGVDSANRIALQYEINPDPERVFYAHNTFVQTYLEQGPLGALGMLLLVGMAIGAALLARRHGIVQERRALFVCGLGVFAAMQAHGLTDQVVTTNLGTLMLLLALAAMLAALPASSAATLSRWALRGCAAVVALVVVASLVYVAFPTGRSTLLLNLGGLEMDHALALPAQSPERASALSSAEDVLGLALAQDSAQPAVLRDLAWVRSARFDDVGGLTALKQAAESPRIDAFDMLQIAHVYRDLGATDAAYALAVRSYSLTGRSLEDAVMGTYAQATLSDPRARTLADQAEAAMRARTFGDAHTLFQQALTFEPDSQYLQDRIGASQRAVDKYGP